MTPNRSPRLLDPVSRTTEVLFGLIMVLTFTATFNASEAGREDVRLMLIAAIGCSLACQPTPFPVLRTRQQN